MAFLLDKWKDTKKIWISFIMLAMLFVSNIPLLLQVKNIVRDEGFYITNEGTTTVQDEYMPRWVEKKPNVRANEKLVFFAGRGTIEIIKSSTKKYWNEIDLRQYLHLPPSIM